MCENICNSTIPSPPNPYNLRCLQINLHHSKLASANLAQIVLDLSIDVVLIQEPYAFSADTPVLSDIPPGFYAYHDLSSDHAYGAAILIRQSLVKNGDLKLFHKGNHAACVEIHCRLGRFRFASLYLRPSLPNFVSSAKECLEFFSSPFAVIGVDSNAKNQLWNSIYTDQKGIDFEQLALVSKLNVMNATLDSLNFVPGGTSFVDVTLAGDEVKLHSWRFLPFASLSDHPFIYFETGASSSLNFANRQDFSRRVVPRFSSINQQLFLELLKKDLSSCPSVIASSSFDIVEQQIDALTRTIVSCARAAKDRKIDNPAARNMPWWSRELCALRTKARQAYRVWSLAKSEESRSFYRLSKSVFQRELRKAKNRTWADFRRNTSPADTFKELATFTGKTNTISLPDSMMIDGVLTSNSSTIVEGCANHFFPTVCPSTAEHVETETMVTTALSCTESEMVPSVSNWEFEAAVSSMIPKTSSGPDGISPALVLLCMPLIKIRLMLILNACLSLCFFPSQWKSAKVSIIGKQNKKVYDSLHSFRPISLGNTLSKLMEKIILNRLSWFASSGNWFSKDQHGFRPGRSTETAGHALVSLIENNFSNRLYSAAVFLDIKSAFDCAWHPAILAALLKKSCPLYLVRLVKNFLSNRKAHLTHKESSLEKTINLGCPQGGVLSPFLWNVMLDDVLRLIFPFPCKIIAYADDLTVITSHRDPMQATLNLQKACDIIGLWLKGVKLSLNAIKSVFVIFHRFRAPLPPLSLVIDGVTILTSQSVTFLGFLLDAQLKWSRHINEKCIAAKKAIFAVNSCLRKSWGFDRERLLFLYRSVVEPILLYGVGVWAGALRSQKIVKSLRSFQRSITLLATRAFKTAPTDSLLLLSGLLPVDLRAIEIASRSYKSSAHEDCFSPSSRRQINRVFPLLEDSLRIENVALPHLSSHPPWNFDFSILSLPIGSSVSLFPSGSNTFRYYLVGGGKDHTSPCFGAVCCNNGRVVETGSYCLSSESPSRRVVSEAVNWALISASSLALQSSSGPPIIEIFISGQPYLSFMRPATKLNPKEVQNLSLLCKMQDRCTVFCGLNETSEGYVLAYSQITNVLGIKRKDECLTARDAKLQFSMWANDIWNREWCLSSTGAITRLFFPSLNSASVVGSLQLSPQMAQVITGHCSLNVHQHRFGFKDDLGCECGAAEGAVEHFLFYCPKYERDDLIIVSLEVTGMWPPPLARIPEDKTLWLAMSRFVRKSKRISSVF